MDARVTSSRQRPRRLLALLAGAVAVLSTMLVAIVPGSPASAAAGELTEVTGFGSNPGNLQMFEWVPADLPPDAPVVVVLHGCFSNAASYDTETGLAMLADRWNFALVFPQQKLTNNATSCFNSWNPEDQNRGQGEALSVKQMVDWMHANRGTDPDRTYVMGHSGGGFFTSVMLATYPDVFKAGATLAGAPYKCGSSETECGAGTNKTPQEWGDLARSGFPGYTGAKPRVSIWHGTGDTTVNPSNLNELMEQWTNYHGIDQAADVSDTVKGYPHRIYQDTGGAALVETYSLTSRGHGWPIDPGTAPDQCDGGLPAADYDICAGYHIGKWFGIIPSEHATRSTPRGPTGDDFYYPPPSMVDGPHGSVIWARRLTGAAALRGADNWLVLYRSRSSQGEPVAVSGTVALPDGDAPDGGWPVMSWGHGTTGVADLCAPSRDSRAHLAHPYLTLMDETLARWVQRGFAVTKTDYQGLGTHGPHSYLIGVPEARAAADLTRAAHALTDDLSSEWVVTGHSQGGQTALFTGEIGQQWVPELDLRGAVAFAPGSNYGELFALVREGPIGNAALMSVVIRGVETAIDLQTRQILTSRAWELLPHTDDRCIEQLRQPDSWGGMTNDEVFKDDADLSGFDRVIDENDPKHLSPSVPVFLAHGGQDDVAPHAMSDALYAEYVANGTEIEYHFYPEEDHRSVVAASYEDVAAWVDSRLEAN